MDDAFAIMVLAFALLALAIWGGCETGKKIIRNEAAGCGAGEYYIGTNYTKEFRWKTNSADK